MDHDTKVKLVGISAAQEGAGECWDEDFEFEAEAKDEEVNDGGPAFQAPLRKLNVPSQGPQQPALPKKLLKEIKGLTAILSVSDADVDWDCDIPSVAYTDDVLLSPHDSVDEELLAVLSSENELFSWKLAVAKGQGSALEEARATFELGVKYFRAHQFGEAADFFSTVCANVEPGSARSSAVALPTMEPDGGEEQASAAEAPVADDSEESGRRRLDIDSLRYSGMCKFHAIDYAEAIALFEKALSLAQSHGLDQDAEILYYLLARTFEERSSLQSSLAAYVQQTQLGAALRPVKDLAPYGVMEVGSIKTAEDPFDIGACRRIARSCLALGRALVAARAEPEAAKTLFTAAGLYCAKGGDTELWQECAALCSGLHVSRPESPASTVSSFAEDWDESVEDADEKYAPMGIDRLKAMFDDDGYVDDAEDRGEVPERFVLEDKNLRPLEIVRYPRPTPLHSLKLPDGRAGFSEAQQQTFLTELASQSGPAQVPELGVGGSVPLDALYSRLQYVDRFSVAWVQTYLDFMVSVYHSGNIRLCRQTMREYFGHLSALRVHFDLDEDELRERQALFATTLMVLYVAAKFWTPGEHGRFHEMLMATLRVCPQYSDALSLLEIQTLAHHANLLNPAAQAGLVPSLLRLCVGRGDSSSSEPAREEPDQPALDARTVQCHALASLQLVLLNLSPLTCRPMRMTQEDDSDSEELYNLDEGHESAGDESLDHDGVGHGSLPVLQPTAHGGSAPDSETCERLLSDDSFRTQCMLEAYAKCPTSFEKAKCAYALVKLYLADNMGDDEFGAVIAPEASGELSAGLCESLAFEAVYMLSVHVKGWCQGQSALCSELGCSLQVALADVYVANRKVLYALAVLGSAVRCLDLRRKDAAAGSLRRRLASLFAREGDVSNAVEVYASILEECRRVKKTNEAVYVSEVVAKLLEEQGDYNGAEGFLHIALDLLGGDTRTDSMFLRVQLRLAKLHLSSARPERAVDLLQMLSKLELHNERRFSVLVLLARAYLKKRWLTNAAEVLRDLDNCLTSLQRARLKKGELFSLSPEQHDSHAAARSTRPTELRDLAAKFYHLSGRHTEALAFLEASISECTRGQLSMPAGYYYRKGKCLAKLGSSAFPGKFPTSLSPRFEPGDPVSGWAAVVPQTQAVQSSGHFVGLALDALRVSYELRRTAGAEFLAARTLAKIARLYLDRLFIPVALLRLPFHDFSSIASSAPASDPSEDSEPLRQLKHLSSVGTLPGAGTMTKSITLAAVEETAFMALEQCVESCPNPLEILQSYLNVAEVLLLQSRGAYALAFWKAARDLLFRYFVSGTTCCLAADSADGGASVGFLEQLCDAVGRLVAFLFCMDKDSVNENLILIDTMINVEVMLAQARKRPTVSGGVKIGGRASGSASHGSSRESSLGRRALGLGDVRRPTAASLSRALGHSTLSELPAIIDGSRTFPASGHGRVSGFSGRVLRAGMFAESESGQSDSPGLPRHRDSEVSLFSETYSPGERGWGVFGQVSRLLKTSSSRRAERGEFHTQVQMVLRKLKKVVVDCHIQTSTDWRHMGVLAEDSQDILLVDDPYAVFNKAYAMRMATVLKRPLIYTLLIREILVYYVPESGRKRVHKFGGCREEIYQGSAHVHERPDPSTERSESQERQDSAGSRDEVHPSLKTAHRLVTSPSMKRLTISSHSASHRSLHFLSDQLPASFLGAGHSDVIAALIESCRESRLGADGALGAAFLKRELSSLVTEVLYFPHSLFEKAKAVQRPNFFEFDGGTPRRTTEAHPSSVSRLTKAWLRATESDAPANSRPVTLVSSFGARMLPWDMVFSTTVVRFMTLLQLVRQLKVAPKHRPPRHSETGPSAPAPPALHLRFYARFFPDKDLKPVWQQERVRAARLVREMRSDFGLERRTVDFNESCLPVTLFNSSIVRPGKHPNAGKRRRYKFFNFIDLPRSVHGLSLGSSEVEAHFAKCIHSKPQPVLLLSHADLAEFSTYLDVLVNTRSDIIFLFVPAGLHSVVGKFLVRAQAAAVRAPDAGDTLWRRIVGDEASRRGITRRQLLLSCVATIERELLVPVVVMNLGDDS